MDKFKFERFITISKVDEDERMVYGFASTPDLDSDGEVITLEAIEKSLPGYMKFPTIREMHQPKAIGATKSAEIVNDKKQKGLYIGAKIIADDAWKLVKEGVYKAFSIGGNVVERVGNVIHGLELVEISLVDVPANKKAVIEIWKRDKVTKSAETVYALANLMIQLKDTINYYKYIGKDTKSLEKALEIVKKVISVEALETEKEEQDRMDEQFGIFDSRNPETTKVVIDALEAIKFDENPMADAIRKGVIVAMKKSADETEVQDQLEETTEEVVTEVEETKTDEQPTAEETTTEEETTEVEEQTEEETPEDAEETEDETEEETVDEEEKETSASTTLSKLNDVNKKLDNFQPKKEVKKLGFEKAVKIMAETIEKMTGVIEKLENRIEVLEKTPAAPKSQAVFVRKGEDATTEPIKENDEVESKKTRLNDLKKLLDQMGPNEFAKRGYSLEAQRIEKELELLRLKA